jgi:hypothetical protein
MLKVQTSFEVLGELDGFAGTPLRIRLVVIEGGLLVAHVTPDSSNSIDDVVLIDAKASIDLFESTESHLVYSCQFSLVKLDTGTATIVDCAARISEHDGLVGRWNVRGFLGKKGVCDHAFEMKSIRTTIDNDAEVSNKDSELGAISIASAVGALPAASDVAREVLVRGDAVDQHGNIYTTAVQALLHADGSVTGVSSEDGKRCKLTGVWSGSNLSYTIEYPLDSFMTHYTFRGMLTSNADGTETFSGTWKYDKRTPDEDEMYGGFEFRSKPSGQPIMPGAYMFTGTRTSNSGFKCKTKLLINLVDDGTLSGSSEDFSMLAPPVYQLKGSWDAAESIITFRTSDTDGLGSYEFVGRLDAQQLTGHWVKPRGARLESERGAFAFRLTPMDVAVAKQTAKLYEQTPPPTLAPLLCRELLMCGDAVDQYASTYATTLQVLLHPNGTVTGVSNESGKPCKLSGEWSGSGVTYTLDYPMNGIMTQYSYRGVLATNADGTETLSGSWDFGNSTSAQDKLFGTFTYRSVDNETAETDAIMPGQYTFTGAATADDATDYVSKLTLNLSADGTITGTSNELSIAPQVCELTGLWDVDQRKITYGLTYTNGATGTYKYEGTLVNGQLIGHWVNPIAANLASERGAFAFNLALFTRATVQVEQAVETTSSEKTAS